ncbi:MAG: HlyD family efflux transporter periplasmic adaptor subunit [Verrucomicrobia bacterium]|nr:HlyD family efflux transporter periplasmic adaptor subunit [Verrucomicrobiota bacterium]
MKQIGVLILLLAVGIGVFVIYRHGRDLGGSNGDAVRVSGNIEVTEVELSFKVAGRLVRRAVSEGDLVRDGELVAQLDPTEFEQEAALRRAEVSVARAMLAELEAGARPQEIAQAEAALELAKAEEEKWRLEHSRQRELHRQGVTTDREYELAEAAWKSAAAKVREASERLALLVQGPRQEQIDQARARLEQAQHGLALAETRLREATLVSPLSGIVLSENVQSGEYVLPGTGVVTVGDLSRPWLRAYINETDLGRVKLGQRVIVTTDTWPNKAYEGRVTFISSVAEFTPRNVQTHEERVKLVYRIKVGLANPRLELKPGMPADGIIDTSGPTTEAANQPGSSTQRSND